MTKNPEDSGNEIGKVLARKLAVNLDGQIEPANRIVYSGFCLRLWENRVQLYPVYEVNIVKYILPSAHP